MVVTRRVLCEPGKGGEGIYLWKLSEVLGQLAGTQDNIGLLACMAGGKLSDYWQQ